MSAQGRRDLPARLEGVRRRFEDWRRTRKVRSRIPKSLWVSAVKMAGTYGIYRTAKALRVDDYSLKKRVAVEVAAAGDVPGRGRATPLGAIAPGGSKASGGVPEGGVAATFLELTLPTRAGSCECTLELEDAGGAKMRGRFKGVEFPDLTALSRSFWHLD
ncbi:MAG TPA: hypothetical protein VMY37_39720 [Thermoguttaceae bacterium]|nr:hypothetical protein [Thermoguttaceae bacterium]